jgi:hypothetical protein
MEQLICERYSVGSPASGTHKAMMLFVCASRCTPFIVFHLIAKETEQEKWFSCCSQSNSVKFLRIQISFPLPLPSKAIRRSTKIYMREREPLEKLLSILEQIAYHLDEKKPGHK